MVPATVVRRAFDVFRADAEASPPLTLRGGNAVDGYDQPPAFSAAEDEPTDAYLEGFAFWGLVYLDAQSWRHYLPRLIDYASRHPDDPAMVAEALVRSLRPPDRYPPRLATLTGDQEDFLRSFLENIAFGDALPHLQGEAQQALEEWWLPNPRSRPSDEEIAAARAVPTTYRAVEDGVYRLLVPDTFTSSGPRSIPEESRRVQTWGGLLCSDAPTVIAVNVTPLDGQAPADAAQARGALFRDHLAPREVVVRGSARAVRVDGLTHGHTPAEPQTLTMVFAVAGDELVTLSVRSWPRDDLGREVERVLESFEIVES